jgi:hypothetical protein
MSIRSKTKCCKYVAFAWFTTYTALGTYWVQLYHSFFHSSLELSCGSSQMYCIRISTMAILNTSFTPATERTAGMIESQKKARLLRFHSCKSCEIICKCRLSHLKNFTSACFNCLSQLHFLNQLLCKTQTLVTESSN